jgi:small subunit ribosomal protein S6
LREYELTFIVQPEISDEGCEALHQKLDAVLAEQGSIRLLYDDWGKRKLAYEVERFQKGHYFVLSFLDEGKTVPELERLLRLEESVLRFLTVLVDEQVKDIEARKRAERAAREAEEAKAREAAEQARAAEEAERRLAAEAAAAAAAETAAETAPETAEDSGSGEAEAVTSEAPAAEAGAAEAPAEPAGDETPKEKSE